MRQEHCGNADGIDFYNFGEKWRALRTKGPNQGESEIRANPGLKCTQLIVIASRLYTGRIYYFPRVQSLVNTFIKECMLAKH